MVQDEESAQYEGMPRSAIATGLVDYVLPQFAYLPGTGIAAEAAANFSLQPESRGDPFFRFFGDDRLGYRHACPLACSWTPNCGSADLHKRKRDHPADRR